jgi:V/A-type H+/Na+-transporting ATPase subunit F
MEIAAVGRDEFVQGFKLVGVRKAVAATPEDLEQKINTILEDPDIGILVLESADVSKLGNAMRRRLQTVARPVVIGVGTTEDEDLRSKIKRAIGIDLLK